MNLTASAKAKVVKSLYQDWRLETAAKAAGVPRKTPHTNQHFRAGKTQLDLPA
jgi:hypothetical protein